MSHRLPVALLQLNVSDCPEDNLPATLALVDRAAAEGARLILTPEATNMLSHDRARYDNALRPEDDDPTLAALRDRAAAAGVWLVIGSLALRDDEKFRNRSFLIAPDGSIAARYDKIHMFDVRISDSEVFRESASYRPGDRAVVGLCDLGDGPPATPVGIGMTICYDLRFPALYRRLAQGGARILSVPAAFNPTTGAAHWHALLRARAIETGCFVLAPAQCGIHGVPGAGAARRSYGHSLVVSPWGEVLADAGDGAGVTRVDLDLTEVDRARSRIPSLTHDRDFTGP